ncbi:MAG: ribosome maturation factor RimM [Tannerellaceae bacterium]|jgi:16S rRNA processing protein RimM|nr:ribosome maturation factor RimM [Tannerellaceae bacterium]
MLRKEDVVKIGRFTKPHGVKGEIGLTTTYDIFECNDNPFLICEIDGILVPFFIEEYRSKTETVLLVKLETIHSEDVARKFSNCDVYYPLQAVKKEEQNLASQGWSAYVGYSVSDKIYGLLGEITAVDESTINTLLKINNPEKEILVPGVEEWIIAVDYERKHLEVVIPSGLLEL